MKTTRPLRFLITAGPTREFFDPIRFISNRSSGKMGYALATAARAVSPRVTLVSGPTALTPPKGVEFVPVTSAQEMAEAVLSRYDKSDVVIMTAAVCDFRPKHVADLKIKKQKFAGTLELVPTIDILAELGKRKRAQLLIGFAAETDNLERNDGGKLERKNLDVIVANDASAFEADSSSVMLIYRDGTRERLAKQPKVQLARLIVKRVLAL